MPTCQNRQQRARIQEVVEGMPMVYTRREPAIERMGKVNIRITPERREAILDEPLNP
jgi:hypothetical protein